MLVIFFMRKANGREIARYASLGSDLSKADAHAIQPDEYDEIPELTDKDLDRGKWYIGSKEVTAEEGKAAFREALKRGRPKSERTKTATTIRFDEDVLAAFKATGRGWQTRMNDALREWLREHPAA
jgi:uncharacterized protein (DUF4415 family)